MTTQTEILVLAGKLSPQASRFNKIRVGSMGDGGYVLPDDLGCIDSVLSLGIGGEVSFDHYFAAKGARIYQYDPTVEGPPQQHDNFVFHKLGWGPENTESMRTLDFMMSEHRLFEANNSILKFDVEAAEWDCLRTLRPELLRHFRMIVCELHGLTSVGNTAFMQGFRDSINVLTRHHTAVHLHANNCCGVALVEGVPLPAVVEVTLLRNDRSDFSPCQEPIPGPLDFPSMADRPDITLRVF